MKTMMIDARYQVLKPFPSFQLTRRILNSTNPSVRRNIIQKNAVGISALEKAAMYNKPVVAAFLTEVRNGWCILSSLGCLCFSSFPQVFCALGEDVLCKGKLGNSLIHALARKGDDVAPALESLLQLRFNDAGTISEDGIRVYNADNLINSKNETPLHMAASTSACHSATIRILHKNLPSHASLAAEDGLPLHYACQVNLTSISKAFISG